MNLTSETFEAALRPNTKAVIVVHFGGLLAAIEPILEVATRAGVPPALETLKRSSRPC